MCLLWFRRALKNRLSCGGPTRERPIPALSSPTGERPSPGSKEKGNETKRRTLASLGGRRRRRWAAAFRFALNPLSGCPLRLRQAEKSMASAGPTLESLVDQVISVITNDGRNIVGTLRGFDQATNIILDESHERVYSTKEGVQQLVLGLYIIRGDNIGVVGEVDEELDAALDMSKLRAQPLKPVIH